MVRPTPPATTSTTAETGPAPTVRAAAPAGPRRTREEPSLSYIPALDGVRAFAVLGVMAYHGGIPWLPAGFLGVDAFFVLSGFLITSLLISEWQRRHTIALGQFWARRARRLLPALLLLLVFVVLYAAFVAPAGTYPGLRLDALSTLFYVANWHFILIGSNYFDQTGLPSLLTHTWSLAVEEQFYLVWPLVVLGVLKFTGRLWALLAVSVVGALASAAEMALLFRHGVGTTRLYYGTDTHGQCLLVGAALASGLALFARRRHAAAAPSGRAAHSRGGPGVGGLEPLGPYPPVHSRGSRGGGRRSPVVAGLLQRLVSLGGRVLGGRAGHGGRPALRGLRPAVVAGRRPSRSAPCATWAASPTACTSGTFRSSSGSTGSGPG